MTDQILAVEEPVREHELLISSFTDTRIPSIVRSYDTTRSRHPVSMDSTWIQPLIQPLFIDIRPGASC